LFVQVTDTSIQQSSSSCRFSRSTLRTSIPLGVVPTSSSSDTGPSPAPTMCIGSEWMSPTPARRASARSDSGMAGAGSP
jgi:hypothetical protein